MLCRRQAPLNSKTRCCGSSSNGASATPAPHPMSSGTKCDLEGLSEKYWGEILERTVSSNSLQRLQKVYGHSYALPARPNGNVLTEMRLFETGQIEI